MVMPEPVKKSLPVIGIIFLLLAVLKFLQGGNWVVWLILAILFGALRFLPSSDRGPSGPEHKA
jgi:membrane-bound ClpP family serine protease